MPEYDIIIAGAGLAGVTAAFTLSRTQRVLLLDAEAPGAGASGMAAGMVNPISGLRAKPAWRMEEAIEALDRMVAAAGAEAHYDRRGVLRPAKDEEQAGFFKESAERYPSETAWIEPGAIREAHPLVAAPHGALRVHPGGVIRVGKLITSLVEKAKEQGLTVATRTRLVGWRQAYGSVTVEVANTADGIRSELKARRLLLTLGAGVAGFDVLGALDLHPIKGQLIRISRPAGAPPNLLSLAGNGYLIDEGDALLAGSSYEHSYADLAPSPAVSRKLLREATQLIPRLSRSRVVSASVGVRITVPRLRLPMVGHLPGRNAVWLISGLGSKGLLMAPMIAANLVDYFADPASIPDEIQVRVKTG
ncbi:MAG: FAD-dependent oxidoreductase [Rhodothermales bacterium]|nr:FAD-dependent oxidoreductase [Rhodothermales bacterium]